MRPWIVSAALVAAVAAGVLWWTRPPVAEKRAPGPGYAPLEEREVRAFIEIWPGYDEILRRAAQNYVEGGGGDVRVQIETHLRKHNLTLEDFDRVRQRIFRIVEIMRWIEDRPDRDAALRQRIEDKRKLLDSARGEMKTRLAEDIAVYESALEHDGPLLHESDRALARRYWSDLDRLVQRPAGG